MKLSDDRPILGIDPSKRGLAFVFFVKGTPIDWGLWRTDNRDALDVCRRVLDTCPARVLVVEDSEAVGCQRRSRIRRLLQDLAAAARDNGLEVRAVARQNSRDMWASQGVARKDEAAALIAKRFPVLQPLVPRFRKVFMDEEPRSRIFDAASLVLLAFGAPAARSDAA